MKTQKVVEYSNDLEDVKSEYHHNEACQIAIFLSGKTPKDIKEALLLMVDDIDNKHCIMQGIYCYAHFTREVIRPSWIDR